ncbi:MAG: hypothetical protein KGL39_49900 [Patescibacteria group bacterium]|nr:hypothetical protein [Patescibacteria group bacterium]
MKVETTKLKEAIRRLKNIVPHRMSLPILACAKLEAVHGELSLTANNLDMEQTERIPCDGDIECLCVPLRSIEQALFNSPDTLIEMDGEKSIVITCGREETILDFQLAEDFPKPMELAKPVKTGVSTAELAEAVENVKWCASTDTVRYILCGVHVAATDKKLRAEATDGKRLCVSDKNLISAEFDVIIPNAVISGFSEALARDGALLSVGANGVLIEHNDGSFRAKLLEGNYPNTEQVMDKKPAKLGSCDLAELADVLARCSHFTDPARSEAVSLQFGPSGLELSSLGAGSAFNSYVAGKFIKHSSKMGAELFLSTVKSMGTGQVEICKGDHAEDRKLILKTEALSVYIMGVSGDFQKRARAGKQPELAGV